MSSGLDGKTIRNHNFGGNGSAKKGLFMTRHGQSFLAVGAKQKSGVWRLY
jgi:hypothetical protein